MEKEFFKVYSFGGGGTRQWHRKLLNSHLPMDTSFTAEKDPKTR